jgi:hypothetical protein
MALDEEASKTFLEETKRLWFNSELLRLKQIGSVEEDYQPEKMEVILFPHGENNTLFDNLVIPKERLRANIKYKDCGYVILEKDANGNWEGFFDFRYNKGKAQVLFNSALEFFETAKEAHNAGRSRAFLDNLFSTTELLVQSMLFVKTHNQKYVEDPNHRWTTSELSRVVKLWNLDARYSKTLGNLSSRRDEARYHKRSFNLTV